MNPWTAIGWILLFAICFWLFAHIVVPALSWIAKKVLTYKWYFQTRNIEPAAGQVWRQENSNLRIERITSSSDKYPNRIVIHSGSAGWSDSMEEWKQRVRSRKLYLVGGKNG